MNPAALRSILFGTGLLILAAGTLPAQPKAVAGPASACTKVGDFRKRLKGSPQDPLIDAAVAVSPEGLFVASCPIDPEGRCEGRFFDPAGKPRGGALALFPDRLACEKEPAATFLRDGSAVVAWACAMKADPQSVSVWIQRADAGRGPLGPAVAAGALKTGRQGNPHLVPTPDGGFWALWIEGNGTLAGRKFQADGTAPEPAEPLTPAGASGPYRATAAAWSPGGELVFVWAGGGTLAEIYLGRRDASGKLPPPVRVSDEKPRPFSPNIGPDLAINGRGEIAVVWARQESPSRVWARVFSPAGEPLGPEFRVGPEESPPEGLPRVTGTGSGFVASWFVGGETDEERAVFARPLAGPGKTVGTPVEIASPLLWYPPLAFLESKGDLVLFGWRFVAGPQFGVELSRCTPGRGGGGVLAGTRLERAGTASSPPGGTRKRVGGGVPRLGGGSKRVGTGHPQAGTLLPPAGRPRSPFGGGLPPSGKRLSPLGSGSPPTRYQDC